MPETDDRRHCPTCGKRDETANHIGRCAVTTAETDPTLEETP